MNYNKKIRILVISETDFKYNEKLFLFKGIQYDIETFTCKVSELADSNKVLACCKHHLDLIISETIDFTNLKTANSCLTDAANDDSNLICKNFFKFHGTFILLNKRYEDFGYSKVYNEMFPYCSYFKEMTIVGNVNEAPKKFKESVTLQLNKTIALATNFTVSSLLVVGYLKEQVRALGFWLQLLPYLLLSILICASVLGYDYFDKKIMSVFPFYGSHLYPEFAVVRPISLIMILWTCLMYGIFHLPNLFGFINHRTSKGKFSENLLLSFLLLAVAFVFSGLRLFDNRIAFDNETINTVKSSSFFFSDLLTLICLFLVDIVILISAYNASKSGLVTKREEINLSNIYAVYFNTIFLCDLPILLGNLFLYMYEYKITDNSYRFVYSIGTASASLFVLQLIYFGINIKTAYDEYLRS